MPNKPHHQSEHSPFKPDDDPPADSPSPELKSTPNSELLDAVLRETAGKMADEEALDLITRWIAEQPKGKVLDFGVVKSLVEHLLHRQFRDSALAKQDATSVAQWLWDDPRARARISLLWGEARQR